MKIVEGLDQSGEAWLSWRRSGVSSTDIAPIMGKCKYRNALDVFHDKIGVSEPIYINPAMKRGTQFESEGALWLSSKIAVQRHSSPCIEHPELSFMHSSLDYYDEESGLIAEIKVPSIGNYKSISTNQLDWEEYIERYKYQLQWHMAVADRKMIVFIAYSPEEKDACMRTIIRDDSLIDEMMDKATEFWNNLQEGVLPANSEKELLVLRPSEAKSVCNEYERISVAIKILEKQLKILREEILDYGDDGDFKLWNLQCKRTLGRTSYDYKKMKEDGIDISKYEKKSIGFYTVTFKEN